MSSVALQSNTTEHLPKGWLENKREETKVVKHANKHSLFYSSRKI